MVQASESYLHQKYFYGTDRNFQCDIETKTSYSYLVIQVTWYGYCFFITLSLGIYLIQVDI